MKWKSSKNSAKMTAARPGRAAALVFAGLLAACGPRPRQAEGPGDSVKSATAKHAIEAAMGRYVAASNRGDIEALAALYADDAVLLPPDHGPIEGRKAIAEFWRQGTDDSLTITTLRIEVDGDLGYLVGRYRLPATEREPADSGKYLMCLRRQRDGAWKVAADIWNSSVTADSGSTNGDETDPASPGETRSSWPVS